MSPNPSGGDIINSFGHAVLSGYLVETVAQIISRSINPDVFVDNMKRNSGLQNTWSSCIIQMLQRQLI